MSWTTAISDLRTQLSDGPTDRLSYRKRCIGEVNGTNTTFKTFEFRRVTDLSASKGVWVGGSQLAVGGVTSDDVVSGEFQLATAPAPGQDVEATYYTQWFLDAELDTFLQISSRWALSSAVYANTPDGLIPAVMKYAAAEAYLKMAQRWRDFVSSAYKLEDAPQKEASARIDSFTQMSKTFREEAENARKEFYTRQDRNLQPLFGVAKGSVRSLP